MTNPTFNPEDPRLTGFVLGEIDDSDRAEIEQLLETSEEAQAAVKEIEETIGVLKEGLASEPTPELTPEQRAAVEEQFADVAAASATAMPATDVSADRTQQSGARFGKLAGVVASVCALGLLVTVVLPALENSNDLQVSSTLREPDDSEQLVAMGDVSETEEAFTVAANVEMHERTIQYDRTLTKPIDEILSTSDIGKLKLASEKSQLPIEQAESAQKVARFKAVADKERRVSSPSSASKPFAEGRSEKDFAKRDTAQAGQRLIADTDSRPQGDRSAHGSVSGILGKSVPLRPSESKPSSAPMAERGLAAKNDAKESTFYTDLSRNSPQSGDGSAKADVPLTTAPASDSRGGAKVKYANQLAGTAGGKGGEGPQVAGEQSGNGQPAKPHTRETVVRNSALVAPGDLANPYLIDKSKDRLDGQPVDGAATDSPAPGQPVALVPAQNEKKPQVLFLEESDSFGRKKLVPPPGPSSEVAVLRQIREREEALARGGEAKTVVELSDQNLSKQSATRLAAVDSGTEQLRMRRSLSIPDTDGYLKRHYHQLPTEEEGRQSGFGIGNETYEPIIENDFIVPVLGDKEKSLSTISVDVDTASYANMRRFLNRDQLPPANSVRIEELVNYFKYNYPEPEGDEPFSVMTELAQCPWQPNHRLAMVGLKAKTIDKSKRPPTNLVFLLDVSGSMRASNKLPLVQQSMRLLVEEMTEDDRVSIVTYASNAGVRLQSTLGSKKQEILNAINGLRAGGSTNGEGGIRMAYDEANRHYFQGGSNRVILCSDGDFNVGKSSDGDLVELIQEKAASGVFLSVFGFGMGNLKDAKLEKLADKGNGHYGYIDNLNEAKKVFQDELVGTLYTVAKDVKLQVEFNPATVGAYRLIGYENRKLAAQDFTDDTRDAGEIGSGHTVTALYEIIPKQVLLEQPIVEGLKYQAASKEPAADEAGTDPSQPEDKPADATDAQTVQEELLTVKLRYKKPDEEVSQPVQRDFALKDVSIAGKQISAASNDLMFAASVASFGMNLRGSKYRGNWGFAEALETAQGAQSDFDQVQRAVFVQLVQRAMRITGQQVGPQPRTDEGTTTRPGELDATAARIKASVGGKYRRLVKKIEVRDDFQRFGAFNDYGHWDGTEYLGHKDLPPGNWVYVYPNWYIWAEAATTSADTNPEGKSADEKPAVK